ncbi:hypothetical protein BDW02DRAFT_511502, partial [Decorospora gaudefroyi]
AEACEADSFVAAPVLSVVAEDGLVLVLNAVVCDGLRQIACPSGETVRFRALFS